MFEDEGRSGGVGGDIMNNRTDDLLSDWLDDGDENPASESDVPSTEAIEIVA